MDDEFIYINYSVEDIEKYLQGRMNAKDMHELERAALQDPFLADAIEGYRDASFSQTYRHLNEISAAILGEKEPAKIVAMPVKTNRWWRAAAIIGTIVIAAAAVWYTQHDNGANNQRMAYSTPLNKKEPAHAVEGDVARDSAPVSAFYSRQALVTNKKVKIINGKKVTLTTSGKEDSNTLAVTSAKPNANNNGDGVKDAFDSTIVPRVGLYNQPHVRLQSTSESVNAMTVITGKTDTTTLVDKNVTANISSAYTNNTPGPGLSGRVPLSNIASGPSANQLNVLSNNLVSIHKYKLEKFEGFVEDDKKQPLGNALVYDSKGRQMAVTDSKGYFRLNTSDSQLTVMLSSAGYETKQATLKSDNQNYILINPAAASLAAVEVTEFKNKAGSKKLPADSLFPEGGWQSFQEYVYKKLHKTKDMDTTAADITSLDGSVEIEFTVDDNGIARDLKITKSLNEQSDAKALEVVQQWPRWIATKKDKKGKVVIQF